MVTWYVKAEAVNPGVAQLKLQMTSDATQRPVTEQEPTTLY